MPQPQPVLLTFDEAGERLRLSERTVRRLAKSGELTTVRVGAAVRVHVDDLAAFADSLRESNREREAATS